MGYMGRKIDDVLKDFNSKAIIESVIAKYAHLIKDRDELHGIKLRAIWQAIKNFDPTKNVKWTTYLYHRVSWECKNTLTMMHKKNLRTSKLSEAAQQTRDMELYRQEELQKEAIDTLNSLNDYDRELIEHKYINNMSLAEMSKIRNKSPQCIHQHLKIALARFKKIGV